MLGSLKWVMLRWMSSNNNNNNNNSNNEDKGLGL
jgi:hypothetical protein